MQMGSHVLSLAGVTCAGNTVSHPQVQYLCSGHAGGLVAPSHSSQWWAPLPSAATYLAPGGTVAGGVGAHPGGPQELRLSQVLEDSLEASGPLHYTALDVSQVPRADATLKPLEKGAGRVVSLGSRLRSSLGASPLLRIGYSVKASCSSAQVLPASMQCFGVLFQIALGSQVSDPTLDQRCGIVAGETGTRPIFLMSLAGQGLLKDQAEWSWQEAPRQVHWQGARQAQGVRPSRALLVEVTSPKLLSQGGPSPHLSGN